MRMNDTSRFEIDTCDWPTGLKYEDAVDKAKDLALAVIRNLTADDYHQLLTELTEEPDERPLTAFIEQLGHDYIEAQGLNIPMNGCNFFLYYRDED